MHTIYFDSKAYEYVFTGDCVELIVCWYVDIIE